MKYIFYFLFFLFFSGCTDQKIRKDIILIENFPIRKSLHSSSINKIKEVFYSRLMGLRDSILIFCDSESSMHFYIYKVPEFKFLGSFGKQGQGPSDIHNPVFWSQIIKKNNSYKAWIYQFNLMKFVLVDIKKALISSSYLPEKEIIMPPEISDAINMIFLNNNMIVGSGSNYPGDFFIYNISSKNMELKPYFIEKDDEFYENLKEINLLGEYNRGIIKIKPDGTRFIKAFLYKPIIDIYNIDAKLIFSIQYKDSEKVKLNMKNKQFDLKTRLYYLNIFLTDNYIYALNQNCYLENIGTDACQDVEIDVFNWQGEAICKYILNEGIGDVGPFVVDEVNQYIYTINPKSENDYFSIFKL